jgi:hypothetical protein
MPSQVLTGSEYLTLCAHVAATGRYIHRVDVIGLSSYRVTGIYPLPKPLPARPTQLVLPLCHLPSAICHSRAKTLFAQMRQTVDQPPLNFQ